RPAARGLPRALEPRRQCPLVRGPWQWHRRSRACYRTSTRRRSSPEWPYLLHTSTTTKRMVTAAGPGVGVHATTGSAGCYRLSVRPCHLSLVSPAHNDNAGSYAMSLTDVERGAAPRAEGL